MIDIKYKDNCEAANIAGRSIAEARGLFQAEFNISEKATAFLNDKKISSAAEPFTVLTDNDVLVFKASMPKKSLYLVGALLLAMAITGGIFASAYTNASATINATLANYDFAQVTSNNSSIPTWIAHGLQKNPTGSGTLFDINTQISSYTGDFVATISLANVDVLMKVYRNLTLSIEIRDSANNLMDINSDNITDINDFVLLTLENSQVLLNVKQASPNIYTVKLKSGYYICNIATSSWLSTDGTPLLYCSVNQR